MFERRGYLTAGSFVPEVVLEHPELVRQQYEEFAHAGSDVVLAFTVISVSQRRRNMQRQIRRKLCKQSLMYVVLPATHSSFELFTFNIPVLLASRKDGAG